MSYKREVFADGTPLFYFPLREWLAGDVFVDEPPVLADLPEIGNGLVTKGVPGPGGRGASLAMRVEKATTWGGMTRQSMTGDQSRCAWVRTTHTDSTSAYEGDPALTVYGDSTGSVWDGFGVHAGKVRFSRFNNSVWQHFDSTRSVNDGRWHHIAVTYNSSSLAVTVYVDGESDGSGTMTAHQSQGGINMIGRGFNAADGFDGELTLMDAWSSVLPAHRIRARYLTGSRVLARRRAGLMA